MTSEEIKKAFTDSNASIWTVEAAWLNEIAYQLAVMNERNPKLENINSIVNGILDGPQKGQNQ